MGREKKKGTSGNAKAFISRDKALKKLQLSLQEFRRLCILKGIYPRDPRKKFEGSDKTYYLRKDIDFLAHERLINTLRQQNAHRKKVVKARSKRRIDVLRRLALNTPRSRLDHLVLERYPNFVDAIRELDDPLCIIALFANLPADHKVGIAPERVAKSQRLLREFHSFVAQTNCLRKVFVSIKGYYFQANLMGENVTWITPHRFSQVLPDDVDYSVLLTFLELYECIMSFVNFRLYTTQNLSYPPKILRVADANAMELSSLLVEKIGLSGKERNGVAASEEKETTSGLSPDAVKKAEQLAMESRPEDESDDESSDTDLGDNNHGTPKEGDGAAFECEANVSCVFQGKSFVLGREVPYVELEFCLKAAGAVRVTREDGLPESENRLSGYTHWVMDRPKVSGNRDMSLEYVQPQYVFDSINAAMLLPTLLYGPGTPLPPHLSPFVTEEDDGGYRPWFKDIIDRIKQGDTSVVEEAAAVVYAERDAKNQEKSKERKANSERQRRFQAAKENAGGTTKLRTSNTGRRSSTTEKEINSLNPQSKTTENESVENHRSLEDERMKEGQQGDGEEIEGVADSDISQDENGDTGTKHTEKSDRESEDGEDEEGKEEELSNANKAKMEIEGREMATLMLSRKKMRQYQRHKRAENKKAATKEKLVQKRKRLEAARAEQGVGISKRRRQ